MTPIEVTLDAAGVAHPADAKTNDKTPAPATAGTAAFDRVLYTPHEVDVQALARAYGWDYRAARTKGELDQALSAPPAGVSIVEVPLSR